MIFQFHDDFLRGEAGLFGGLDNAQGWLSRQGKFNPLGGARNDGPVLLRRGRL